MTTSITSGVSVLALLLLLLIAAGLAVGVTLLVVWLVRRNPGSGTGVGKVINSSKSKRAGRFDGRRAWFLVASLSAITALGFLIFQFQQGQVDTLSQREFLEVLDTHRVLEATVRYESNLPGVARVTGKYTKPGQTGKASEARFKTERVRLTERHEEALRTLGSRFEEDSPNVIRIIPVLVLLSLLLIASAVVVGIALFIVWLVRRGQKSSPAPPPIQTPTSAQTQPKTCPRCGAAFPGDSPQGLCPRCVLGVGIATETEATGELGPHGTKIVPPPEAEVARRFPHLEILGCLGHGGMGVVYKARQPKLNRLVALKILAPEKGADPKFAERFLREAQALARLSHPNIVTVHDFGEADGMFFLLMEYVDGMTLRQLLREGLMKPEQALAIVPRICEALQFAHEQGVVHRDIKPENVLLDKQGRVKIADFGIAKLVGMEKPRAALTEERSVIGTPHYMAPEQVEKPATVDHRADIYSLGVVFYEMLTGELPLGKFQPPSKKVQVDVRLDEVVLHALEKEPERRYQRASQVKTDVETIAATPPPRGSDRQAAPSETARPAVADAKRNGIEAGIVFGGTVFFLLMLAVVAEMSLRAGPFRGFLVVMCVIGLIICALSLAGIWPYPSPWFPEPNFSSRNLRREKAAADSETEKKPRYSKTAIVGACWAGIAALAPILHNLGINAEGLFLGTGRLLILLAFTAPFGTTILGVVAISQIRHSCGRLYGLGLAVFDALLFPLLVLDALIVVAAVLGLRLHTASHIASGQATVPPVWVSFWWFWLAVFGIIVLVDWLLIRAVRRAVNKPVNHGAAAPPPAPASATRSSGAWKILAVIGAVGLLVLAIPIGYMLLSVPRPSTTGSVGLSSELHSTRPAFAAQPSALIFGPVIERVIVPRQTGTDSYLDLDTGRILAVPPGVADVLGNNEDHWQGLRIPSESRPYQYISWLRQSGADLMANRGQEVLGFDGYFCFAHSGDAADWDNWDRITPEQVVYVGNRLEWGQRYRANPALKEKPPDHVPGAPHTMRQGMQRDSGGGPTVTVLTREQSVTYYFRTREGASGLLQIAGFTDDPPGVKIRYKLVQAASTPSAAEPPTFLETMTNFFETISGDSAKGMRLECSPGREQFSTSDRVWINCRVINTTRDTKPVAWTMNTGGNFCLSSDDGPVWGGLLPVPLPHLRETLVVKDGYPAPTKKILFLPPGEAVEFTLDCGYFPKPQKFTGRIVYDPLQPYRDGWVVTNGLARPPWADQLVTSETFTFEVLAATGASVAETEAASRSPQSRVRPLQSEPTRNLWRWRVSRTPGTRIVYGVLDVTDPQRPRQVLMTREDTPLATASAQDYTLRLLAEANHWRVEIEDAWVGESGGRGAVWEKIDCPPTAALRVLPAEPFGELVTNRYHVFWRGDLVSGGKTVKRLCFVARLAAPDDPIRNILDASDPVRKLDEGAPGQPGPDQEKHNRSLTPAGD